MNRQVFNAAVVGVVAIVAIGVAPPATVASAAAAGASRLARPAPPAAPRDPTSARDEVDKLQSGWQRSDDELWTLRGDAVGLHLLAASASSAYSWRTVTTLGDPGVETDRWIGHGCLTASGRYAVIAYAPRAFTNSASLYLRGASVAVVDMVTGAVRKPSVTGNLAYYNPGCGAGEDAVLTQSRFPEESGRPMATRLYRLHARDASVDAPVVKSGQYSSAVPTSTGIVATVGGRIVRLGPSGAATTVVRRAQGAFDLHVDAEGGLTYLTGSREHNAAYRVAPHSDAVPRRVASSTGTWLAVQRGVGARVFILSEDGPPGPLGDGISVVRGGVGDEVSTLGQSVLLHETTPSPRGEPAAWTSAQTQPVGTDGERSVSLRSRVVSTGKTLSFRLASGLRPSRAGASGLAAPAGTGAPGARRAPAGRSSSAAADVGGTGDAGATCAVPRNDAGTQVYQPTPRQIEWAADQAVVNNLKTARPANWHQSGLASWVPQTMFPAPALHGGGRVPVQVLLGILAQESNLWQASGHALSGEFGNPLVGNYYGRSGDGWSIDYANADCGYGVGQVTDGMRKGAMAADKQRAIALDYETNIARSLQILIGKWNEAYDAGLLHDRADPSSLENWVFAVWAYNTGFYPNKGDGSPWGVGWFNNPANPIYPTNRGFFNLDPHDPAHPSDWPYEEKVFGWAAYSIATPDGPGFRAAWWVSEADRAHAKPPVYTFCDSSNACTPKVSNPCPAVNSSCWWHTSVTYNNCAQGYCGHELLRFNTTYPEQPDGTNYPPSCTLSGLPSGSLIVDDVPASAVAPRAGCGHPWTEKGTFGLSFASPSARADFHQIGGGFGGHFWFAHTRTATQDGGSMRVTGTWRYTTQLTNTWGAVYVHMPDHGAETQQPGYQISRGDGTSETRYTPQRVRANQWVSLGVLKFNGYPSISTSSQTYDGDRKAGVAADDIAFDAVAIKPLAAKPKHFVVAMGDSFSSGEGASTTDGKSYYDESDFGGEYGEGDPRRNACHRSAYAWSRKAVLADSTKTIGERQGSFDPSLDYHLIACSGAEAHNLLPEHTATGTPPKDAFGKSGAGQYGELSQIDQGFLDANTTLVTLSIGGNDALFGPIISTCASPIDVGADCLQANDTGDGPNETAVPALIRSKVKASVLTAVRQIHARAPNAKVLLMGYPQLISDLGRCVNVGAINEEEAGWIDDMSLVMDNALAEDVATLAGEGVKIEVGAPIGDFSGKGVCGSPEDINGVVLTHTDGDLSGLGPSQQSFHPKIDGTTLYAAAANRALRALGQ